MPYMLGAAVWLIALALSVRIAQTTVTTPALVRRIDALRGEVQAWQAAHDHHVGELDRRMRRVEEAAARAETEARMVVNLVTGREASS